MSQDDVLPLFNVFFLRKKDQGCYVKPLYLGRHRNYGEILDCLKDRFNLKNCVKMEWTASDGRVPIPDHFQERLDHPSAGRS